MIERYLVSMLHRDGRTTEQSFEAGSRMIAIRGFISLVATPGVTEKSIVSANLYANGGKDQIAFVKLSDEIVKQGRLVLPHGNVH